MPRRILILTVALASLAWTAAGESSDPVLASSELPSDIAVDCPGTVCPEPPVHATRWIGRARGTDLFVVVREPCGPADCAAWLVARSGQTTATLLALTGEFRFEPAGGRYPAVQTRTELGGEHASYVRYEWDGSRYARTQTRLVHRVDGIECGSAAECDVAAHAAAAAGQHDRAVRIWQQVHGVDWI